MVTMAAISWPWVSWGAQAWAACELRLCQEACGGGPGSLPWRGPCPPQGQPAVVVGLVWFGLVAVPAGK